MTHDLSTRNELTIHRLKEVLHYDPDTGEFHWLKLATPTQRSKVGDLAGTGRCDGYAIIWLDGRSYRAHRLAFFYMTGRWPAIDKFVDHEDRNRLNNKWSNLKEKTFQENQKNRKKRKHSIIYGPRIHKPK